MLSDECGMMGLSREPERIYVQFLSTPFLCRRDRRSFKQAKFNIHVETMLNVKIAMCNKLNLTETQLCTSEATHSYHFSELEKSVLCGADELTIYHLNPL